MLARRIIPCLDVKNGRVVKGVGFVGLRDAGDPVEQAARYDRDGADEIALLDITATHEARGTLLDVVARTAEVTHTPLTVGGGVRSIDDVTALLRAGADKVSINSAAVRDPGLVERSSARFGAQAIVVAIDAKRVGDRWEVFVAGGRTGTGLDAIAWAEKVAALGAGAAGAPVTGVPVCWISLSSGRYSRFEPLRLSTSTLLTFEYTCCMASMYMRSRVTPGAF